MAKKASKKTVRRKATKEAEVTIVRLEAGKSVRIGLHDVIKAVQMIESYGHLRKFASRAKRQNASVTAPAETVNFVKDFVAKFGMHKNRVGKHIVQGGGRPGAEAAKKRAARGLTGRARDDDPHQCHFD